MTFEILRATNICSNVSDMCRYNVNLMILMIFCFSINLLLKG